MVEESKYCTCVIKKHFNKELVTTKENDEDCESCSKCWICGNTFVEGDAKVKDHVAGNYRGAVHGDCNTNLTLNYDIPIVFHSLKNYDANVMQELGKFDFKINAIANGLEKYMSFSLDDQLVLIDSFQFLSSSLNSLVKNLGENDFKHLCQEFDSEVLDLVKQEGFYPYEYMYCMILKSLMKYCLAKTSFIVHYVVNE